MPSRKRRGLRLPWAKEISSDARGDDASDDDRVLDEDDHESEDGDEAEDSDKAEDSELSNSQGSPARRRRSLPRIRVSLTAMVAAVLVILLGVGSWLFLHRPVDQSPVELTAFDEILSAARSGIVDVTSFDYLTLDQDIAEIDAVTTAELHDDTIAALTDRRDQLVTDQQVSSTEVIAASVTEATATRATALIVLRARVKNLLTPQETVTRYRIEVKLELVDGHWLLSGLSGA